MRSGTESAPTLRIVVASANPDKVVEIRAIVEAALADAAGGRSVLDGLRSIELMARPASVPDVIEDADSLLGNARLKAHAILAATGLPSMADDTGLEVDALDGAPGIYAARFAGEHATYADNVAKLLDELARRGAVDAQQRAAVFRTVAVLAFPDGSELTAEGRLHGAIAPMARGQRGFGYDPVFVPNDGDGRTFAEMSAVEKDELSHRGRAFRALVALLIEHVSLPATMHPSD